MTFKKAVEETPEVAGAYRPGLQALLAGDRPHVAAQDSRRLTGSINLDEALRQDNRNYANAPVWDYGIGHQPANRKGEMVYWVEIHPATSGEIKVVLAKLAWLKRWLAQSAPKLNALPREYVWISSGKTSLTPSAPQKKQFAAQGLRQVGRILTIPDNAEAS